MSHISAIAMFTTKCDIMSHHHFGASPKGENGGRGPKMVEMVMGAVGVTKCHTSLQLLCLLQSVTLCHTITLGLPQRDVRHFVTPTAPITISTIFRPPSPISPLWGSPKVMV